jgi:ElaB/YqjD/DUF883 family membrane-anchored ribosome-binding protein
MTTDFASQRARVMQDIELTIQDAQALLRMTTHEVGEEAAQVRARVQERLHRATQELDKLKEAALESGKEAADATEAFVQENPWKSLGIAAAAGLVIGLLISRR